MRQRRDAALPSLHRRDPRIEGVRLARRQLCRARLHVPSALHRRRRRVDAGRARLVRRAIEGDGLHGRPLSREPEGRGDRRPEVLPAPDGDPGRRRPRDLVSVPLRFVEQLVEDCVAKRREDACTSSRRASARPATTRRRRSSSACWRGRRTAGIRVIGPNCMGLYYPARRACRSCRSCRPSRARSRCSRRAAPTPASSAAPPPCAACATARSSATATAPTSASRSCSSTAPRIRRPRSSPATSRASRDGAHFMRALRKAAAAKPVVILKGGRTEAGSRADSSHTGSLAGSLQIFDSAVRQAGAVRVDRMEELVDQAVAFRYLKSLRRPARRHRRRRRRLQRARVGRGRRGGARDADAAAGHPAEAARLHADGRHERPQPRGHERRLGAGRTQADARHDPHRLRVAERRLHPLPHELLVGRDARRGPEHRRGRGGGGDEARRGRDARRASRSSASRASRRREMGMAGTLAFQAEASRSTGCAMFNSVQAAALARAAAARTGRRCADARTATSDEGGNDGRRQANSTRGSSRSSTRTAASVGGPFAGAAMLILHDDGREERRRRAGNPLVVLEGRRPLRHRRVEGRRAEEPRLVPQPRRQPVGGRSRSAPSRSTSRRRVATGAERDRLYAQHAAKMPAFIDYQKKTTRKIPVVVLTRRLVRIATSTSAGTRGRWRPPSRCTIVGRPWGQVRGDSRRLELAQELALLARRHRHAGADGGVAGERRRDAMRRAATPLSAPSLVARHAVEQLDDAARDVVAGERRRHGAHDVRAVAEVLDVEAQPLERVRVLAETAPGAAPPARASAARAAPARSGAAGARRREEALVEHALVRGVLVDEVHAPPAPRRRRTVLATCPTGRSIGSRSSIVAGAWRGCMPASAASTAARGQRAPARASTGGSSRAAPTAAAAARWPPARRRHSPAIADGIVAVRRQRAPHGALQRRRRPRARGAAAPRPSSGARSRRPRPAAPAMSSTAIGRRPTGSMPWYASSTANVSARFFTQRRFT